MRLYTFRGGKSTDRDLFYYDRRNRHVLVGAGAARLRLADGVHDGHAVGDLAEDGVAEAVKKFVL